MLSIADAPPTCQTKADAAAAALVAAIEEKALRREIIGRARTPLVCRSISDRNPIPHIGPLPPWSYHPPTGTTSYLRVYHKDVCLVRCHPETPPPARVPASRSAITHLSPKSIRRLNRLCRNGGHVVQSQFMLSYHEQDPHDGAIVQKHLHAFLKVLRRLFGPSLRYLWVLEFQWKNRPGVPHYHVFLSVAAAPGSDVHHKMAAAWVRITEGSEAQYRVHAHPKNWGEWVMNDGVYITKNYIAKKEQKEVPAHYSNVGRFWGCSRNFVPVPTIIEPETIAPWSAGWAPDQIERTIVRTLRRYHERCMNYDRQSWTKRAGRKPRKSPLRQGDTNCAHSIPFAAPILYQLLDYMAEHPPDVYAVLWYEKQVPF